MASTTLSPPETKPHVDGRRPGRNGSGWGGGDSGGDRRGFGAPVPAHACQIGMYMALAAVTMLFATFTSALVVRKGLSSDWRPIGLPRVLWLDTAVLLASSATLELSRRPLHSGKSRRLPGWWYATVALGAAFLAGQLAAWRELAARGVYLASNPSSSFFYLLTGAHGLHLAGGICALCYVVVRARRGVLSTTLVDVTAIYWHSMDALWIYLFLLLTAGRWF